MNVTLPYGNWGIHTVNGVTWTNPFYRLPLKFPAFFDDWNSAEDEAYDE